MKASADFEQARDAPVEFNAAGSRFSYARKYLEQRRLARAVATDDADNVPRRDFKTHVFERPEHLRLFTTQKAERLTRDLHHGFAQRRVRGGGSTKVILLAYILNCNDWLHAARAE